MRNEHKSLTRRIDVIEIVKKSFALYRKYVKAVVVGGTLLLALTYVTQIIFPVMSLASLFVTALLTAIVQTGFVRYLHAREQGQNTDTNVILQESIKYLPYALAITAVTFTISVVGTLLLVIPGIIWSIMFSQAFFYIVLEKRGILESLHLSRSNTKGKRLAIFQAYWGVYFPFFVATALVYFLIASTTSSAQVYLNGLLTVIIGMLYPIVGYELYTILKNSHKTDK